MGAEQIFAKAEFAREIADWLASDKVPEADKTRVQKLLRSLTGKTDVKNPFPPPPDPLEWKTFKGEPIKPPSGPDWRHYTTTAKRPASGRPGGKTSAGAARPGSAGQRPSSAPRPGSAPVKKANALEIVGAGMGSRPQTAASDRDVGPSGAEAIISSSKAAHGLRTLYPKMYKKAEEAGRPEMSTNLNFTSEWGDSQKTRADETWAPLLHSTNEITNAEVWGPDDKGEKPDAMMADWAQQQRLYYAQLLKPEAAAKLDKLLPSCTVEQRHEIMRALRTMKAAATPEKYRPDSHTKFVQYFPIDAKPSADLAHNLAVLKTRGFVPTTTKKLTTLKALPPGAGNEWKPRKMVDEYNSRFPHVAKRGPTDAWEPQLKKLDVPAGTTAVGAGAPGWDEPVLPAGAQADAKPAQPDAKPAQTPREAAQTPREEAAPPAHATYDSSAYDAALVASPPPAPVDWRTLVEPAEEYIPKPGKYPEMRQGPDSCKIRLVSPGGGGGHSAAAAKMADTGVLTQREYDLVFKRAPLFGRSEGLVAKALDHGEDVFRYKRPGQSPVRMRDLPPSAAELHAGELASAAQLSRAVVADPAHVQPAVVLPPKFEAPAPAPAAPAAPKQRPASARPASSGSAGAKPAAKQRPASARPASSSSAAAAAAAAELAAAEADVPEEEPAPQLEPAGTGHVSFAAGTLPEGEAAAESASKPKEVDFESTPLAMRAKPPPRRPTSAYATYTATTAVKREVPEQRRPDSAMPYRDAQKSETFYKNTSGTAPMKWAAAMHLEPTSSYERTFNAPGRELNRSAAAFKQFRQQAVASAPVNVPFNRVDPVAFPGEKIRSGQRILPVPQYFIQPNIVPHVQPGRNEYGSSVHRGQFVPKSGKAIEKIVASAKAGYNAVKARNDEDWVPIANAHALKIPQIPAYGTTYEEKMKKHSVKFAAFNKESAANIAAAMRSASWPAMAVAPAK